MVSKMVDNFLNSQNYDSISSESENDFAQYIPAKDLSESKRKIPQNKNNAKKIKLDKTFSKQQTIGMFKPNFS